MSRALTPWVGRRSGLCARVLLPGCERGVDFVRGFYSVSVRWEVVLFVTFPGIIPFTFLSRAWVVVGGDVGKGFQGKTLFPSSFLIPGKDKVERERVFPGWCGDGSGFVRGFPWHYSVHFPFLCVGFVYKDCWKGVPGENIVPEFLSDCRIG